MKIDRLRTNNTMRNVCLNKVVPKHTKRQFYPGRVHDKVVPKHTKRQFYPGRVQDKDFSSRIRIMRPR